MIRRRDTLWAGAAWWAAASGVEASAPSGAPSWPLPQRELRGAWVASVAQIDWPSQPGLGAAALRESIDATAAQAASIGLNALFLQIRPSADALYASSIEPWSEYLVAGTANDRAGPGFDPLEHWLQACRRHGLELHAWFNPYRVRHSAAKGPAPQGHLARQMPPWVVRYGDQLWMDPGHPESPRRFLQVLTDVVGRYDIDGVHVDDYFYPYPVKGSDGRDLPFPDDATHAAYRAQGGIATLPDWRRQQVDQLVEALYDTVRSLKPWVRVSISPFGLGRPDLRPAGVAGFSQYDQLYADVERWQAQGWMDALVPQLYWPRSRPQQPFEPLLDAWIQANGAGRALWTGLFTSSVANGTPQAWSGDEIVWQIERSRERAAVSGHVHFSLKALLQDRAGLASHLRRHHYAAPSLPPEMPWQTQVAEPPVIPVLWSRTAEGGAAWSIPNGTPAVRRWVLWRRSANGSTQLQLLPAAQRSVPAPPNEALALAPLDAYGRLAAPAPLLPTA